MEYEKFRDDIQMLLYEHPEGLSWTEIKNNLSLDQTVPNNIWVKRLEEDINLKREIKKTTKRVWRL